MKPIFGICISILATALTLQAAERFRYGRADGIVEIDLDRAASDEADLQSQNTKGDSSAASMMMPAASPREMVWVNPGTGIYYREGGSRFGNTPRGRFMTEEQARAAGYRLAR
jgi:hypothetical protein